MRYRKPVTRIDHVIANNIHRARLARSVAQRQLANELGITAAQVCKYEKCQDRVSASGLAHIAAALGYDVADFYEDTFLRLEAAE